MELKYSTMFFPNRPQTLKDLVYVLASGTLQNIYNKWEWDG